MCSAFTSPIVCRLSVPKNIEHNDISRKIEGHRSKAKVTKVKIVRLSLGFLP